VIRGFLAAHPLALDVFIAALYLVPSILGTFLVSWSGPPTAAEIVLLVLTVVTGAALLARRRQPAVLFAIATALLGASVFLGRDVDVVPTLFALYALAVYRSIRSAWVAFAITSAVTVAMLTAEVLLA